MSSYAADLAAIFSAPYEPADGEPRDETRPGSPKPKEEPTTPLMTSTPHVKAAPREDSATADESASPNRREYEPIQEDGAMSKEATVDGRAPKEEKANQTPKRSPTLNIAVNPLNAMANSIAEAFKKRSPTVCSRSSFLVASPNGSGVETSLKYTPLNFDDEEQLPICGGTGSGNLNANNNNSASVGNESLAANGGVTTYGTASNHGGQRRSGGRGRFDEGVKFKSPFSVLVVCLGVLLVFTIIICLSAAGKKAKKTDHIVPLHPTSSHREEAEAMKGQSADKFHREAASERKKIGPTESHKLTKSRKHNRIHALYETSEKVSGKRQYRQKMRLNHVKLEMLFNHIKREMSMLSNSSDIDRLRKWRNELATQMRTVERNLRPSEAKTLEEDLHEMERKGIQKFDAALVVPEITTKVRPTKIDQPRSGLSGERRKRPQQGQRRPGGGEEEKNYEGMEYVIAPGNSDGNAGQMQTRLRTNRTF